MRHQRLIQGHRYTYAEYVALELESPAKHECFGGEIYAMAGGSEEHSVLAAETLRVYTSDLRICVESTDSGPFDAI